MTEFRSIMAVSILLWTVLILYIIYLDSKTRDIGKKISNLERLLKK